MGHCALTVEASLLMTAPSGVFPKQEELVSVVVILLMFLAVITMVKRVDENRQPHAILAPVSPKTKDRIRLQISK
jgi:hypothetical protein